MRDGRGEWIDYSLAMFAVLGLFVAAGCTSDGPGLPEDPPEFVLDWGSSGSGDGDFMRPLDIAVDQAGFVYVADAQLGCVQKFTPTGEFVARWDIDALLGNDVPEYARFAPSALAADTAGVVFVGASTHERERARYGTTVSRMAASMSPPTDRCSCRAPGTAACWSRPTSPTSGSSPAGGTNSRCGM